MKVYLNKNKLDLAFVEYDIANGCIKPNSELSVVCIKHGMTKSQLATQLRDVADYLEVQQGDIIVLQ